MSIKIAALAGGVGGAKMAHGLAHLLPSDALTVIVNTGDDFTHWGLSISPDLDTVCYTLAGLANPETGWGRADETWQVFQSMQTLGAPDWFRLGDRDLATHLARTTRLRQGEPLSRITQDFCQAWGVTQRVLPMSDQPVATMVNTLEYGELSFQEYFVMHHCAPQVTGFRFEGIELARPAPGVLESIEAADAVVFCPSNPWVSIDPILAVGSLRATIQKKVAVGVSPIIGGQTVKGPAAKMYAELGITPSALAVAQHYQTLLHGFVMDTADARLAGEVERLGMAAHVTQTLMKSVNDRVSLSEDVLNFIARLLQ